jgi:type IV pilus assembly protein PilA
MVSGAREGGAHHMEPRSAQSPGAMQWLLLSTGVVAFIAVSGVVGIRLARNLLPKTCCGTSVSEAKANLKGLFTAQRALYQEKDVYSEDMNQIGFEPELGNRYTYFSAPRGRVLKPEERKTPRSAVGWSRPTPYQIVAADPQARKFRGTFETFAQTGCPLTPATLPDGTRAGLGITLPADGAGPGVFIGVAVANIDGDPTPDCWSVATVDRVAADGTRIYEGQPYNELNDVEH